MSASTALIFALLVIPALLILGISQKKSRIVARLCGSLLCAIPFFIMWFVLTAFIMLSASGMLGLWCSSVGCAVLYIICLLFIWKVFNQKKRRVIALSMAAALFVGIAATLSVAMYQNNISEASNSEEFDLYVYQPFIEDTRVKSLDEPSYLRLESHVGLPRLDGATALYPLYSAFVRAVYPDEDGIYSPYGDKVSRFNGVDNPILLCSTTAGAFNNLLDGKADIVFLMGVSDEQRTRAEEMGLTLQLTPIGSEAFVFLVNKNNAVSNLTVQNVKDIYSGAVKDWKHVGGKSGKIRAYQRPKNSGSQTMLEQIMGDTPIAQAPEKDVYSTMGGLYKAVANYKNYRNALGYSFRFYINDMISEDLVKLLPIDGVEPNIQNIANGSYPFAAHFYAVTVTGRGEQTEEDVIRTDNTKRLIEWILSPQGQSLVEKTGYIPLSGI